MRPLAPDASLTAAPVSIDAPFPDKVWQPSPNPLGGYVEARTREDVGALDVRFVDQSLKPVGDWQTVLTYEHNIAWVVNVDRQGRALVLAFMYPPSFGPPPPPSQWKFSARWMGPQGPLTDAFQPATPIFTPVSPNGSTLFAGWGTVLPLPEGGFAAYHATGDPSAGTISPTGWYAYYPSGQTGIASPPSWLQPYNGFLSMLSGGVGYTSIQYNNPDTCARTVLLISPSGRTCFSLNVQGADSCGLPDVISPDGTLVLWDAVANPNPRNNCVFQWWPGLARPGR